MLTSVVLVECGSSSSLLRAVSMHAVCTVQACRSSVLTKHPSGMAQGVTGTVVASPKTQQEDRVQVSTAS